MASNISDEQDLSPEEIKRVYNNTYYSKNREKVIKMTSDNYKLKTTTRCFLCDCDVKSMNEHVKTKKHQFASLKHTVQLQDITRRT
jgi:PP-loop superfamily ATP-utilizing enzyme